MSREQLEALAGDVDRLLAAGSSLAIGDEGLQRRARTLAELGQQVPVLAQIAQAAERVIQANPKEATPALLDLVQIVRQLRAGLASVGADGPLEPAPQSGPWHTNSHSRDLYGLVESSGEGKLSTFKDAVERGIAADLRLVDPMLDALDAGHAELADFVAAKALPSLGQAILPELRRSLNLKGGRVHARKLVAIAKLDAKAGGELCHAALQDGSPQVRIQALKLLPEFDPAAAERAALELLGQKVKAEEKEAALEGLRSATSDAALEALLEALLTSKTQPWTAIHSLGVMPHKSATERVVEALEKVIAETKKKAPPAGRSAKGKPAEKVAAVDQAEHLLKVLQQRRDAQAVPALMRLLKHKAASLREGAANALIAIAEPKGLRAVADLVDDKSLWQEAIQAALRLAPKECYDRLAPVLSPKTKRRDRIQYLLNRFDEADDEYAFDEEGVPAPPAPPKKWDARWEKLLLPLLKGGAAGPAARAVGEVMGQKAVPHLLKLLDPKSKFAQGDIAGVLGKLKARAAVPKLIELLSRGRNDYFDLCDALETIGDPSAIAPLRELIAKAKDHSQKYWLEHCAERLEESKTEAKQ